MRHRARIGLRASFLAVVERLQEIERGVDQRSRAALRLNVIEVGRQVISVHACMPAPDV